VRVDRLDQPQRLVVKRRPVHGLPRKAQGEVQFPLLMPLAAHLTECGPGFRAQPYSRVREDHNPQPGGDPAVVIVPASQVCVIAVDQRDLLNLLQDFGRLHLAK
jgi:hypothetical protein